MAMYWDKILETDDVKSLRYRLNSNGIRKAMVEQQQKFEFRLRMSHTETMLCTLYSAIIAFCSRVSLAIRVTPYVVIDHIRWPCPESNSD